MSFSIASYKQEMHFRRETGNKNKHSVKKNNWNIELVANIPVYLLLRTNMLHKNLGHNLGRVNMNFLSMYCIYLFLWFVKEIVLSPWQG